MRSDSIIIVALFSTVIVFPILVSGQQRVDTGTAQVVVDSLSSALMNVDTVGVPMSERLDSLSARFTNKLDSLSSLELPVGRYANALDSLYKCLGRDLDRLRDLCPIPNATDLINRADSIVRAKQSYLDSLTSVSKLELLSTQADRLKLPPNLGSRSMPSIPGIDLPNLPKLSVPNASIPKIETSLPDLLKTDLPDFPKDLGNARLPEVPKEVAELQSVDMPQKIEQKASEQLLEVDGIAGVAEQSKAAESLKEETNAVQDVAKPEQLQEKAKEQFVDYVKDKEDIINKDLEDIGKTQLKYRNIADSRFLPKRPPNEMKGKPIVERLIPGVSFQVLQSNDILMDIAPFIGYRFSGKVTATVSGYRRLVYIKRDDRVEALDCFGIRAYNNVKIYGSLSTHVEVERYKDTEDYSRIGLRRPSDLSWTTKVNFGIYQRYSLGKRLYGHFVVMYDLGQLKRFPNSTGSSARFGFDYQLKKRQRKEKAKSD